MLNLLYTATYIKKEFAQVSSLLLLIGLSYSQELEDINFGDDYSLDIATWNIEWFPKNGQTTINYVSDIIRNLDLDIIAIQEVDDTVMFELMADDLQDYSCYYESAWFAGLAYIYKTGSIEINDIYEIYTTSLYWSAFPRSPMVMDINFMGDNYLLLNNHLKCCGDGALDTSDASDEENRRFIAMNLLKQYIDDNLPGQNVIVLGDLNDDIVEESTNNVFQNILEDSENYFFSDIEIANGPSSNWSFPNWPSHLDHILITNEIFNGLTRIQTKTIKIDSHMGGGWSEYDYNVSDHRPLAIKIFNFIIFYDLNDDELVNNSDLEILLSYVMEQSSYGDINQNSNVDIFDLFTLADFLYSY